METETTDVDKGKGKRDLLRKTIISCDASIVAETKMLTALKALRVSLQSELEKEKCKQ